MEVLTTELTRYGIQHKTRANIVAVGGIQFTPLKNGRVSVVGAATFANASQAIKYANGRCIKKDCWKCNMLNSYYCTFHLSLCETCQSIVGETAFRCTTCYAAIFCNLGCLSMHDDCGAVSSL